MVRGRSNGTSGGAGGAGGEQFKQLAAFQEDKTTCYCKTTRPQTVPPLTPIKLPSLYYENLRGYNTTKLILGHNTTSCGPKQPGGPKGPADDGKRPCAVRCLRPGREKL